MNNSIEKLKAIAEASRSQIHEHIKDMLYFIETGDPLAMQEQIGILFCTQSYYFKGTKPTEVVFSDGVSFPVMKWREAVVILLNDCNKKYHEQLVSIVNKVQGKKCIILSDTPERMNCPLKIDEGIYFEGDYSTDTLLNVLKSRIFDAVGYDYTSIRIKTRPPVEQNNSGTIFLDDEKASFKESCQRMHEKVDKDYDAFIHKLETDMSIRYEDDPIL